MTFEDVVRTVDAAGYSWAVEGVEGKYTAIVSKGKNIYISDALATGLGAEDGDTPAAALLKAFEGR